MKIKYLLSMSFIIVSGVLASLMIPAQDAIAAFNADSCPATSLYKLGKGKPASEIKTLADCNLSKEDKDLTTAATDIINVIVGVTGIIAVIIIVIGGILYVTSTGDATKAKRAQHTILYGIVGLIIALLAFAIVNFVLGSIF